MPGNKDNLKKLFEGLAQKNPGLQEKGLEAFEKGLQNEKNLKAVFNGLSAKNPGLKEHGYEKFKQSLFGTGPISSNSPTTPTTSLTTPGANEQLLQEHLKLAPSNGNTTSIPEKLKEDYQSLYGSDPNELKLTREEVIHELRNAHPDYAPPKEKGVFRMATDEEMADLQQNNPKEFAALQQKEEQHLKKAYKENSAEEISALYQQKIQEEKLSDAQFILQDEAAGDKWISEAWGKQNYGVNAAGELNELKEAAFQRQVDLHAGLEKEVEEALSHPEENEQGETTRENALHQVLNKRLQYGIQQLPENLKNLYFLQQKHQTLSQQFNQSLTPEKRNHLIHQLEGLEKEIGQLREGFPQLYDPETGQYIDRELADEKAVERAEAYQSKVEQHLVRYQNTELGTLIKSWNNLQSGLKYINGQLKEAPVTRADGEEQDTRSLNDVEQTAQQIQTLMQGFGPGITGDAALKLNAWKKLHDRYRLEFDAVNRALLLNQNPGKVDKHFLGLLSEHTIEGFGIPVDSDKDFIEGFVSGIQKTGGVLTKEQVQSAKDELSDKVAKGIGDSIRPMTELLLTSYLTAGIGNLPAVAKTGSTLKTLLVSRWGNQGKFAYNLIKNQLQGTISFGLTSDENLSAIMGSGEGTMQGIVDSINPGKWLKTSKYAPLFKLGGRTLAGMTGETAAEFVGDYLHNLKNNGYNWEYAFEKSFGRSPEEFSDKLLATAMTAALFSATSNSSKMIFDWAENQLGGLPEELQPHQAENQSEEVTPPAAQEEVLDKALLEDYTEEQLKAQQAQKSIKVNAAGKAVEKQNKVLLPEELPEGDLISYSGIKGKLHKQNDGLYVVDSDGESHLIESGLSGKNIQQLGIERIRESKTGGNLQKEAQKITNRPLHGEIEHKGKNYRVSLAEVGDKADQVGDKVLLVKPDGTMRNMFKANKQRKLSIINKFLKARGLPPRKHLIEPGTIPPVQPPTETVQEPQEKGFSFEVKEKKLVIADQQTGKVISKRSDLYKKLYSEYKSEQLEHFKKGQRAKLIAGMNEKEVAREIADSSRNPEEIAEAYLIELIRERDTTSNYSKEGVIANNLNPFPLWGIDRFGDRNHLEGQKQILLNYVSKKGTPIDTQAQALSEDFGMEITPEDIYDFVTSHPSGAQTFFTSNENVSRLQERFAELTGVTLDEEYAKELTGFADYQQEEEIEENFDDDFDFLQEEEKPEENYTLADIEEMFWLTDEEVAALKSKIDHNEQTKENGPGHEIRDVDQNLGETSPERTARKGSESETTESSGLDDTINQITSRSEDTFRDVNQQGILGSGKVKKEPRNATDNKQWQFENEAAEKRFTEANQPSDSKQPLLERLKDWIGQTLVNFNRHFKHLDPNRFPDEVNKLRVFESLSSHTKERAHQYIKGLIEPLTVKQKEIFTRRIILEDLLSGIEAELETENKLPFGFTSKVELQQEIARLTKLMKEEPEAKKAFQLREKFMEQLYYDLVNKGLIQPTTKGGYKTYYHRRVLEYIAEENQQKVLQGGKLSKTQKDFMKGRTGTRGMDYSTNFIENEFKVVAESLYELEKKNTLDKLLLPYKKGLKELKEAAKNSFTQELKKLATEYGVDSMELKAFEKNSYAYQRRFMEKNKPEGYVLYQPEKGNVLFRQQMVSERVLEKALQESLFAENTGVEVIAELLEKSRDTLIVGGKKKEHLIPEELAITLDEMGRPTQQLNSISRVLSALTSKWKMFVLLNPARFLKYNLNNMAGDFDGVIAADPTILKHSKTALRELFNYAKTGKVTPTLNLAMQEGVIDSGFDLSELGEINQQKWAQRFLKRHAPMQELFSKAEIKELSSSKNPIRLYFDMVSRWSALRENWLRYAAFLRAMEKLDNRETFYWASYPKQVDGITDQTEKAGKLAREVLGDYGNISESGQYIRKYMIPFYSWMEINMKRYFNLLHNASNPKVQARVAGVLLSKGITKVAFRTLLAYTQLAIFTAAISAYNRLLFPEEEKELQGADTRGLKIILGRKENGKIIALPIVGALYDFLDFFGLPDLEDELKMLISTDQKAMGALKGTETVLIAPLNKVAQGLNPFMKSGFELTLGKSLYPNVMEPRPIRDKKEYAARFVSAGKLYRYITQKPMPKKFMDKHWVENLLTREYDVEEAAYFKTKSLVGKYKGFTNSTTPENEQVVKRREALYHYGTAIRYNQPEVAEKWLEKYYNYGGTLRGLNTSIRNKHPLSRLSTEEKKDVKSILKGKEPQTEFGKKLTPEDLLRIEMAVTYYNRTYKERLRK